MSLKEDIEQAIQAHGAWKAKFRDCLSGKAAFDLASIDDTHACELGRWLAQEGRWLLPEKNHDEICKLHAEFHHAVGAVIRKIQQKDFSAARHDLGREGAFDLAGRALTSALRKATPQAPARRIKSEALAAPPEAAAASPSRTR